ncbi:tyrosine-protein phosphatase [Actinocrispum wychmicini]|nr:tyrosine-protein phosphatase [Actinocrispum wychmicini]
MTAERHQDWEGCYNARDLGGLKRRGGGETRWGTTFRSDNPERLTEAAWARVHGLGIRTVIDLRGAYEVKPDGRAEDITSLNIVMDDETDREFWDHWNGTMLSGTPLYYQAFLDRFPERIGEICTAVARAEPGGVLFHCAAGRDRTGLIALILLALVDVEPEEIAADHGLSADRLRPAWAELNLDDQTATIERLIAAENTTARESILSAVAGLDPVKYLRNAGLTSEDIDSLRARLI